MRSYVAILVVTLFVSLVNADYFNGKTSVESPKRAKKYLKFLKSSSQLLGSGSATSGRYIHSSEAGGRHLHTFTANSGHAYPQHHYGSTHHYHQPASRMGMMTSASERSPSRIIIVRQPTGGAASKKSHHSTQAYSSLQYLPQASSAGPAVAYPTYGAYSSYGYASQPMAGGYGSYQMPYLQMAASGYAPQIATPYSQTSPQLSQGHSPLVASMIAAAQRVTQGQTSHSPYGGHYSTAGAYMSPSQYSMSSGSAYGYGAVPTSIYQHGYGYVG